MSGSNFSNRRLYRIDEAGELASREEEFVTGGSNPKLTRLVEAHSLLREISEPFDVMSEEEDLFAEEVTGLIADVEAGDAAAQSSYDADPIGYLRSAEADLSDMVGFGLPADTRLEVPDDAGGVRMMTLAEIRAELAAFGGDYQVTSRLSPL